MPTVQQITEADPERLVCIAARNDYREDGVIDYPFDEIMANASIEGWAVDEIVAERDLDLEPAEDWVASVEQLPDDVALEARQRTLLKHLMNNEHWGPFEHPHTTIAIEDVTRTAMAQLTRHRHFTFDIMSLRYVEVDTGELLEELDFGGKPMEELFEYPEEFTADEVVSRNGVEEIEVSAESRLRIVNGAYTEAAKAYQDLNDIGVPQEEARKVLPMATKVNMVVSGNARAWMHLLNIRGKANVQGEAREIVEGVKRECKDWMPFTFETYDDMLPLRLTP